MPDWLTGQAARYYKTGILGISNFYFFNTHLCFSLNFTLCHCQVMGGIPLPSRGIVSKNLSTLNKTTVRSKRVGLLGSRWGPFTWFTQCYLLIMIIFLNTCKAFAITLFLPANSWYDIVSFYTRHPDI